jgi:plasmid stabilization system protein ParE
LDAELSGLAATAATTLVGLLTTDAWDRVREGLGALWSRVHPERAEIIKAEITEARDELMAHGAADGEQAARRVTDEWESRIHRLLSSNPDLAAPLRELLLEGPESGPRAGRITQRVRVSGHGRAYVLGQGGQWNNGS